MLGYPSRVRMPLLAYFAVVAPGLLALLYVAEAGLDPRPPQKVIAAPTHLTRGIGQPSMSMPILTIREAPAPPAWALTFDEEPTSMSLQAALPPPQIKVTKIVSAHQKKPKRVQHHRRGVRYATAVPSAYENVGRIW